MAQTKKPHSCCFQTGSRTVLPVELLVSEEEEEEGKEKERGREGRKRKGGRRPGEKRRRMSRT